MRRVAIGLAILAAPPLAAADRGETKPDYVVAGTITGADAQTYKEVAFDVPKGVERITVTLDYDKSNKTVLDLGVWDPTAFRGWSGGTRDRFTIAASDASPGYLPGPLPTGRWHVELGVPNARPGSSAAYTVKVYFDRGPALAASKAIADPPLKTSPGWYRGDLHMHDANSDGSCLNSAAVRVPCPLFRTVVAASSAGLDFVAVTDHNTIAQFDGLRELQPWFNKLLLIPGVEITTFRGHANLFAPRRFVDFRVGSRAVPTIGALEKEAEIAGALFSINHPNSPTGEICMGCGWTWPDTDWSRVGAIEAVNGTTTAGPNAGIGFWYARLNEGKRLTGIGGSDSHDPDAPMYRPPVGRPTTVVYADALSVPAILAGIRRGNVFIDAEGTRDRLLEMTAASGGDAVTMGGTLRPKAGVTLAVHLVAVAGATLELVANGKPVAGKAVPVVSDDARMALTLERGEACGWVSANVRGKSKSLILIGNPIYVDCRERR